MDYRATTIPEQLFNRFRHRYIEAMILATRAVGSIGGVLVVYYVHLTLTLPEPMRSHFIWSCALVVLLAICLSMTLGLWETRHLRRVLRMLAKGEKPDPELGERAGVEAVTFPGRHHRNEAWLVPCSTLVPVCIILKVLDNAPSGILLNVTFAVFMGIGLALMCTFFVIELLIQPVVRYLLDNGVAVNFNKLPNSKLRFRLNLCFGLVILITAMMIGTMAKQRAADIIAQPDNQDEAVASLRVHTTYITLAAIVTGLVFSTAISQSVASRVARLVHAMKRVEMGDLSQELRATSNDEIDILTRQFNSMVQQLAQHDATIRDLNTNLERKVETRTLSLRLLHAELDQRNNELESALEDLRTAQSQLVEIAHRAGMTEIATGVLHNVGNVLNSVNISMTVLSENVRKSKVGGVAKVATLLKEYVQSQELSTTDERIRKLPGYLEMLGASLAAEQSQAGDEIKNLTEKVQHIKNIINAQQNYTRRVSFKEPVDLERLIDELLAMHEPSIDKHNILVNVRGDKLPSLSIEKSKLLQVLDNLIKNAVESMAAAEQSEHVLTIQLGVEPEQVSISVIDTGHGISEEQLKSIFRFGFTTKPNGNGFGLHSAALAMSEMGGGIRVASDGVGRGATFTITLPARRNEETVSRTAPEAALAVG